MSAKIELARPVLLIEKGGLYFYLSTIVISLSKS